MTYPLSPFDDGISAAELVARSRRAARAVWQDRRAIGRLMGLAAIIGAVIAFGSGEEYSAKTRILPYRASLTGGSGSLSGLAGLAGIRLPSGIADQTITADLYPEVAKSPDFRIAVVETPIRFGSIGKKVTTVAYFREIRRMPLTEWLVTYSVGLPNEVVSAIRSRATASVSPRVPDDSKSTLLTYDREYLKLIRKLERRLTVTIDKKTSVITITGQMPDAYAAADLVRVTADRLMERIIDYESRKAGEQFRFVNAQYQESKARYERAQRELAVFTDRNRSLMSATAQIDRDRLQREFDLAFEVYQQFSRELEQARIKMNQDTPVFTMLEQVVVPTERASPQRSLILLVSLLVGASIGAARVGVRRLLVRAETFDPG